MSNRELAVVIQNENKVTPEETIKAVKEAGFKNVFIQWYDKPEWKCSQEEQARLCKEAGLNIIFAHLGYQNTNSLWLEGEEGDLLIERYKRNLRDLKALGIPLAMMHVCIKEVAPMYNELGLKRIKKLTDYAKEIDMKLAFENTKIPGYLEYILSNITDEHVGVCYDAGHVHAHFNDEFSYDMFKNRISCVHLHDNNTTSDQHLIPFEGTINWEYVLGKLRECNYNGPITMELCYRRNYLDMSVYDFYKKGYEVGLKLRDMIDNN